MTGDVIVKTGGVPGTIARLTDALPGGQRNRVEDVTMLNEVPDHRPARGVLHVLVAVVALVLVAAGCFLTATRIMDGLYAYSSPLNTVEIPLGQSVSAKPSEGRLVFVLVDGLRVDTATDPDVMPTLGRLRQEGAFRVLHSRAPSYSAPGWTVLGTGAWPSLNGGEAMNPEGTDPLRWQQDHIFAAAQNAGLRAAVSGNDWWRSMLPAQTWSESYFTRGEDTAADEDVVANAVRWLREDRADLLLVDLNGVDDAGHHHGGPDGAPWKTAARAADDQISRILDTLDLNRDTLLVVSDHGHIGPGGHGGTEREVVTEPLLVVGASVAPGTYPDADQIDVAPTVATILGTRVPAVSQGRPLTDMLRAAPGGLETALRGQQEHLARAHSTALGVADHYRAPADDPVAATQAHMESMTAEAMLPGQLWRGLAGFVLVGVVGVALWRRRGRAQRMELLGAVAFVIGFHTWYALVLRKPYSLSWVEDTGGLIATLALAALVGLAVALPIPLLTMRPWRRGPAAAALGVLTATATIVLVALLPAVVSLVVNGVDSPYTLPEMHTTWFGFTAMLQALVVVVGGLVVAAVAAAVAGVSMRASQRPPR